VSETALVSDNASDPPQREAVLSAVSEVLGLPAKHHRERFLESGEPPLLVVIDAIGVVGALASLYSAGGGPTVRQLYERIRQAVPDRKVSVQFEARREGLPTISYITPIDAPNEALAEIAEDSEREVPDPRSFRWWINGRWMTHAEYDAWKKRSDSSSS
jgi:hypothetical protein